MKKIIVILALVLGSLHIYADGILLPNDTSYQHTFLKNLLTEITVDIHGQMVETTVYQEFLNESSDSIDAVWNFPMPTDARSTRLEYWVNNVIYDAVLKVQQQVVNPGTGDGGIAAVVNQYIGKSGIKLQLKKIPPHGVQKIRFHYFSLMDYNQGTFTYKYPLKTSDFITYYLSYLKVNINVDSKSTITDYDFPDYNSNTQVLQSDNAHLRLEMLKSKAYLASDFSFNYKIQQDSLNVDFYSSYCNDIKSHFGLFVMPPVFESSNRILSKRIVFLIGNSSSMNGYKLQQSVSAVSDALDSLKPLDKFNIVLYNAAVTNFSGAFLSVNSSNIASAKTFLQSIVAQGGSDLDLGLNSVMSMFTDSSYQNCILGFSDGHSVINPISLATANHYKIAICFVAIGSTIDRERLEMTAGENYGFVTYVNSDDNIKDKVLEVFGKINKPIIKSVHIDFSKPDVELLVPTPYPTINAGASFYVAGRYSFASQTPLTLYGTGVFGNINRSYPANYSSDTASEYYVRYLWAKTMMDNLERQILIYGEDSVLIDSLIHISLNYKMKCRYTAYVVVEVAGGGGGYTGIAQKTNFAENDDILVMPNPFGDKMIVSLTIPEADRSKTKLLKIYSSTGILIKVIDISALQQGKTMIDVDFSTLPSGIYFLIYQKDNIRIKTVKVIHL